MGIDGSHHGSPSPVRNSVHADLAIVLGILQQPLDGIVPTEGIVEMLGPPLHPLQPLEYGVPIMATGC